MSISFPRRHQYPFPLAESSRIEFPQPILGGGGAYLPGGGVPSSLGPNPSFPRYSAPPTSQYRVFTDVESSLRGPQVHRVRSRSTPASRFVTTTETPAPTTLPQPNVVEVTQTIPVVRTVVEESRIPVAAAGTRRLVSGATSAISRRSTSLPPGARQRILPTSTIIPLQESTAPLPPPSTETPMVAPSLSHILPPPGPIPLLPGEELVRSYVEMRLATEVTEETDIFDYWITPRVRMIEETPVVQEVVQPMIAHQLTHLSHVYDATVAAEQIVEHLLGKHFRIPVHLVVSILLSTTVEGHPLEVPAELPEEVAQQFKDLINQVVDRLLCLPPLTTYAFPILIQKVVTTEMQAMAENIRCCLGIDHGPLILYPTHIPYTSERERFYADLRGSKPQTFSPRKAERPTTPVARSFLIERETAVPDTTPSYLLRVTVRKAHELSPLIADIPQEIFLMLSMDDQHVSTVRVIAAKDETTGTMEATWQESHTFRSETPMTGAGRKVLVTAVTQLPGKPMEILGYANVDVDTLFAQDPTREETVEILLTSSRVGEESPGKVIATFETFMAPVSYGPSPCSIRVAVVKGLSIPNSIDVAAVELTVADQVRRTEAKLVNQTDVVWNEHFLFVTPLTTEGMVHTAENLTVRLVNAKSEEAAEATDNIVTIPLPALEPGIPKDIIATLRQGTQIYLWVRAGAYIHAARPQPKTAQPFKSQTETSAVTDLTASISGPSLGLMDTNLAVLMDVGSTPLYDISGFPMIVRRYAGISLPSKDFAVLYSKGKPKSRLSFADGKKLLDFRGNCISVRRGQESAWFSWGQCGSGQVQSLRPILTISRQVMYTPSGIPVFVESSSEGATRFFDGTIKLTGLAGDNVKTKDGRPVSYGILPELLSAGLVCALSKPDVDSTRSLVVPSSMPIEISTTAARQTGLFEEESITAQSQLLTSSLAGRPSSQTDLRDQFLLWHSLDIYRRGAALLLSALGLPLRNAAGWPHTIWAGPALTAMLMNTFDLRSDPNGDPIALVGPDGIHLINDASGQLLTSGRAHRTATYLCPLSSAIGLTNGNDLVPVLDGEGKPVYSQNGKIVVKRRRKEYVRKPDGSKVLDSNRRSISQRRACQLLGVPESENLVVPATTSGGSLLRGSDGFPVLRANARKVQSTSPNSTNVTGEMTMLGRRGEYLTPDCLVDMVRSDQAIVLTHLVRDAFPFLGIDAPSPLVLLDDRDVPVYDFTGWPVLIRPMAAIPTSVRIWAAPPYADNAMFVGPKGSVLRNALTGAPLTGRRARHLARAIACVPIHYTVQPLYSHNGGIARDTTNAPIFERYRKASAIIPGKDVDLFTRRLKYYKPSIADDQPFVDQSQAPILDTQGRPLTPAAVRGLSRSGLCTVLTMPRISRAMCEEQSASSESGSDASDVATDDEIIARKPEPRPASPVRAPSPAKAEPSPAKAAVEPSRPAVSPTPPPTESTKDMMLSAILPASSVSEGTSQPLPSFISQVVVAEPPVPPKQPVARLDVTVVSIGGSFASPITSPFVSMRVGECTHYSSVLTDLKAFEWNESFSFFVYDPLTEVISVSVLNRSPGSDTILGEARVGLTEVGPEPQLVDVPLFVKRDNQWQNAEVVLRLLFGLLPVMTPPLEPMPLTVMEHISTAVPAESAIGIDMTAQMADSGFYLKDEGTLKVMLIAALSLESLQGNALCELRVGKQSYVSSPQPTYPLPSWRESFNFLVANEAMDTLDIALRLDNGKLMGTARLKLNNLKRQVTKTIQVTLQRKSAEGKWVSSDPPNCLQLSLTAYEFGHITQVERAESPVFFVPQPIEMLTCEAPGKLHDKKPKKAGESPMLRLDDGVARVTMTDAGSGAHWMSTGAKPFFSTESTISVVRADLPEAPAPVELPPGRILGGGGGIVSRTIGDRGGQRAGESPRVPAPVEKTVVTMQDTEAYKEPIMSSPVKKTEEVKVSLYPQVPAKMDDSDSTLKSSSSSSPDTSVVSVTHIPLIPKVIPGELSDVPETQSPRQSETPRTAKAVSWFGPLESAVHFIPTKEDLVTPRQGELPDGNEPAKVLEMGSKEEEAKPGERPDTPPSATSSTERPQSPSKGKPQSPPRERPQSPPKKKPVTEPGAMPPVFTDEFDKRPQPKIAGLDGSPKPVPKSASFIPASPQAEGELAESGFTSMTDTSSFVTPFDAMGSRQAVGAQSPGTPGTAKKSPVASPSTASPARSPSPKKQGPSQGSTAISSDTEVFSTVSTPESQKGRLSTSSVTSATHVRPNGGVEESVVQTVTVTEEEEVTVVEESEMSTTVVDVETILHGHTSTQRSPTTSVARKGASGSDAQSPQVIETDVAVEGEAVLTTPNEDVTYFSLDQIEGPSASTLSATSASETARKSSLQLSSDVSVSDPSASLTTKGDLTYFSLDGESQAKDGEQPAQHQPGQHTTTGTTQPTSPEEHHSPLRSCLSSRMSPRLSPAGGLSPRHVHFPDQQFKLEDDKETSKLHSPSTTSPFGVFSPTGPSGEGHGYDSPTLTSPVHSSVAFSSDVEIVGTSGSGPASPSQSVTAISGAAVSSPGAGAQSPQSGTAISSIHTTSPVSGQIIDAGDQQTSQQGFISPSMSAVTGKTDIVTYSPGAGSQQPTVPGTPPRVGSPQQYPSPTSYNVYRDSLISKPGDAGFVPPVAPSAGQWSSTLSPAWGAAAGQVSPTGAPQIGMAAVSPSSAQAGGEQHGYISPTQLLYGPDGRSSPKPGVMPPVYTDEFFERRGGFSPAGSPEKTVESIYEASLSTTAQCVGVVVPWPRDSSTISTTSQRAIARKYEGPKAVQVELGYADLNPFVGQRQIELSLSQGQVQRSSVFSFPHHYFKQERFGFTVDDESNQTLDVSLISSDGALGMCRLKLDSIAEMETEKVAVEFSARDENGNWYLPQRPDRVEMDITALGFGKPGVATPSKSALASTRSQNESVVTTATEGRPHLELWLLEGVNLPAGATGHRDPYARLVVGNTKRESRVVQDSLNPVWNQKFEFPVTDPAAEPLFASVWDKKSNDPLGWFTLKLDNLPFDCPVDVPLPLMLKSSTGEWVQPTPPSKLLLSITARNFGHTGQTSMSPSILRDPSKPYSNLRLRCIDATALVGMGNFQTLRAKLTLGDQTFSTYMKPAKDAKAEWGEEFGFDVRNPRSDIITITLQDENNKDVAFTRAYLDHLFCNESRKQPCTLFIPTPLGNFVKTASLLNIELLALGFPFALRHTYGMPNLRVTVVSATTYSSKKDVSQERNPYAVVMIGQQRFQTRVEDSSMFPHWNETCEFVVSDPTQQTLDVLLCDRSTDGSPDVDLGRYRLVIADLRKLVAKRVVCRVLLRDPETGEWKRSKPASCVRLHLLALDSPFPSRLDDSKDMDALEFLSSDGSRSESPCGSDQYMPVITTDPPASPVPPGWGGRVYLQSSPPGATVTIDGVCHGRTRYLWTDGVPGQLYRVTFSLPGFVDRSFSVMYPPKGEVVRYERSLQIAGGPGAPLPVSAEEIQWLQHALDVAFERVGISQEQKIAMLNRIHAEALCPEHEFRLLLELYESLVTQKRLLENLRSKATQSTIDLQRNRSTQSIRHGMDTQTDDLASAKALPKTLMVEYVMDPADPDVKALPYRKVFGARSTSAGPSIRTGVWSTTATSNVHRASPSCSCADCCAGPHLPEVEVLSATVGRPSAISPAVTPFGAFSIEDVTSSVAFPISSSEITATTTTQQHFSPILSSVVTFPPPPLPVPAIVLPPTVTSSVILPSTSTLTVPSVLPLPSPTSIHPSTDPTTPAMFGVAFSAMSAQPSESVAMTNSSSQILPSTGSAFVAMAPFLSSASSIPPIGAEIPTITYCPPSVANSLSRYDRQLSESLAFTSGQPPRYSSTSSTSSVTTLPYRRGRSSTPRMVVSPTPVAPAAPPQPIVTNNVWMTSSTPSIGTISARSSSSPIRLTDRYIPSSSISPIASSSWIVPTVSASGLPTTVSSSVPAPLASSSVTMSNGVALSTARLSPPLFTPIDPATAAALAADTNSARSSSIGPGGVWRRVSNASVTSHHMMRSMSASAAGSVTRSSSLGGRFLHPLDARPPPPIVVQASEVTEHRVCVRKGCGRCHCCLKARAQTQQQQQNPEDAEEEVLTRVVV